MNHAMTENPDLAGLTASLSLFSESEKSLISNLLDAQQQHLFAKWDTLGQQDDAKKAFVSTLMTVDANYPSGIVGYINSAKKLLAEAKADKNPFEGMIPAPPEKVDLTQFNAEYERYEAIGTTAFDQVGIVLVAGGLGERLGYNGIKLDIAVEALESTSYLNLYADQILALQARVSDSHRVPFIIMVSQDTGPKTLETLEANNYFGLDRDQVHVLQQELVPAIADNDGSLALGSTYELILKPHGHGDIHMLLHTSGIAAKLAAAGFNYLMFIQDTNGQVFNVLPAALGVSVENQYDFNSLAVNRVPGEAVGGLAKLVGNDKELTLNVEYNQLDPLLRATISPEGDLPNEEGFSIFPGNCNTLVIRLDSYVKILEASQGIIAEFVNPKYTDASKSAFKKPTRLETMMQDLPKLFSANERVGVTIFDRNWSFSANKNNLADAAAKVLANCPADAGASAESDFYYAGRVRLEAAGVQIKTADEISILGIPFTPGPKVILRPSFALTLAEGRTKVTGNVALSDEATLILDGANIELKDVVLSGKSALIVKACEGAHVTVTGDFSNDGFEQILLTEEERSADSDIPEYLKIRGYRFENRGAKIVEFTEPGSYTVDAN